MQNNTSTQLTQSPKESSIIYYILLGFIFIFQFFSKSKEVQTKLDPIQKKKGDKLFWLFLIALQLAKSSHFCISPYSYEFFEKYHNYSSDYIAKFQSISFLSSSFLGPVFIGFINDKKNKKLPCILFGIITIISSLTKLVKNNVFVLIISQLFLGVSNSILFSSFENWFVNQCNIYLTDKVTKDAVLNNAFEKNAILDAITAISVNYIVNIFRKKYGFHIPFLFSIILCIVTILFVLIFYPNESINNESENKENKDSKENLTKEQSKKESKTILSNLYKCLSYLHSNKILITIGLTESLIFSSLHIFGFIWTPLIKETNPKCDISKIFTTLMISFIAGGTSFRVLYSYYNGSSLSIAKGIGFMSTLGIFLVNQNKNYENVLYGYLCYEAAVGMFYPTYSKIKAELLPKEYRGTMMIIFKLPFNLLVAAMFLGIRKKFSIEDMRIICLGICAIAFSLQMIFMNNYNKGKDEKEIKENDKSKKKKKNN